MSGQGLMVVETGSPATTQTSCVGDDRARTAAQIAVLFKELNERIMALSFNVPGEMLGFVCECTSLECRVHLRLTAEEYRSTHANPRYSVISCDHVIQDSEVVVATTDRYTLTERIGGAGDVTACLTADLWRRLGTRND